MFLVAFSSGFCGLCWLAEIGFDALAIPLHVSNNFLGKNRLQALVQYDWRRTLRLEVGRPEEK